MRMRRRKTDLQDIQHDRIAALEDRIDLTETKKALADFALRGGVSWDEIKAEVKKKA